MSVSHEGDTLTILNCGSFIFIAYRRYYNSIFSGIHDALNHSGKH